MLRSVFILMVHSPVHFVNKRHESSRTVRLRHRSVVTRMRRRTQRTVPVTNRFQSVRIQRVRFLIIHRAQRSTPIDDVIRPVLFFGNIASQQVFEQSLPKRERSRILRRENRTLNILPRSLFLVKILRHDKFIPKIRFPVLHRHGRHHAVPVQVRFDKAFSLVHGGPVS